MQADRDKGSDMQRVVTPLIVIAVLGATAATAWRTLWDDPGEASVANYLRSGVHGMAVAVAAWGCHLAFSSRAGGWLRRWPLPAEVGVRAAAMAITIAAVLVGLQMVLYGQALEATWLLANFPGIFAMAFVLAVVFSAVYELTRLIGGRVLLNVILGRYRHPIREERVLMFLDLAGSTAMAEALGEVRMQELLTRFFFDIDGPIVAHGGEVHAYVGDAVIVTWPITGEGRQWLDCFFAIENRIAEHAESYRREFGGGHQRMRRFPPPDRLFRRHRERDGAPAGALQGGRPDPARLGRPAEARATRPGSAGRGAGAGGVAWTRGGCGGVRRRAELSAKHEVRRPGRVCVLLHITRWNCVRQWARSHACAPWPARALKRNARRARRGPGGR